MRTFHHLALEEREKYVLWKQQGMSLRDIGRRLGRSHTSLSREWKRHTRYGTPYLPCLADRRATRWAVKQRYKAPLKEPLIFLYVREHLRQPYSWSPETIAGRLPLDFPGNTIDDDTIYRYIYGKKQRRMKLWNFLVLHRKKRMKKNGRKVTNRGEVVHAIPISKRPKSILKRKRPGHWETDNMEGQKSDHTGVSVTIERMSRVTRLRKLADHTATTKTTVLLQQFSHEPKACQKTMTVDNGPENKDGGRFQKETPMTVYKTVPYHSWEKGSVENTVGRVRRWIPKKTSVDGITQQNLVIIENQMNNTPRKVLGFLTPNEVYEKITKSSRIR
jgi:IS30 family transposase